MKYLWISQRIKAILEILKLKIQQQFFIIYLNKIKIIIKKILVNKITNNFILWYNDYLLANNFFQKKENQDVSIIITAYKFVYLNDPHSYAGYANIIIWAKLIKNQIFKNVLDYIGLKYTDITF